MRPGSFHNRQRCYTAGKLTTAVCVLLLVLASLSFASAETLRAPEKLVYDLTWTGIKAGTASLELISEANTVKMVSTARSADWVSVFYTVEDRAESTVSKTASSLELGHPIKYRLRVREGRHRKDKEVVFDHNAGKARYVDHLKNEKKDFDIPGTIFDPISSFYYLRSVKLVVGEPVYVMIFDSEKVWNVEVRVLRKEKVTVPIGVFDTVVVKPLMKSEGIFNRKGEILIWLTDDARHLPVKLRTKVAVGSVTATLVRADH